MRPPAVKRRNFLIGGIAASAAVRARPFRVYSFPSQIVLYSPEEEKFLRWARTYIDEQAAKYGIIGPVNVVGPPHDVSIPTSLANAPYVMLRQFKILSESFPSLEDLARGKPMKNSMTRI